MMTLKLALSYAVASLATAARSHEGQLMFFRMMQAACQSKRQDSMTSPACSAQRFGHNNKVQLTEALRAETGHSKRVDVFTSLKQRLHIQQHRSLSLVWPLVTV